MKTLKKMMALMIAMVMVLGMSVSVFAASITVNRDSTYSGEVYTQVASDAPFDANNEYYTYNAETGKYVKAENLTGFVNGETYYTVTESAVSNATYTAYKIFDVTKSAGEIGDTTDSTISAQSNNGFIPEKGVSYFLKSNSPWRDIVNNDSVKAYLTFTPASDNSGWSVSWKDNVEFTEANAKALAGILWGFVDTENNAVEVGNNEAKSLTDADKYNLAINEPTTVPEGYYLIQSSLGTNLVLATSDITITEKNEYPTLDKTVAEENESAQIGDTIIYTIKVTIPDGANQQIVITDTYSEGLTPVLETNTGRVAITQDGFETGSIAQASAPANNSFTITIPRNVVEQNRSKEVTFTYSAVLNKKAQVQDTANTNEAKLQYGSDYTSTTDSVDVTTQEIEILKYDGAEEEITEENAATQATPIAGAVFEVRNGNDVVKLIKVSETEYRVADPTELSNNGTTVDAKSHTGNATISVNDLVSDLITVAREKIVVKGLDKDTNYTLVEIQAPGGFNAPATNPTITPSDVSVEQATIVNNKGTVLPSTGGIGTTIFYIVGTILVIGAGVVLISRKRMAAR